MRHTRYFLKLSLFSEYRKKESDFLGHCIRQCNQDNEREQKLVQKSSYSIIKL